MSLHDICSSESSDSVSSVIHVERAADATARPASTQRLATGFGGHRPPSSARAVDAVLDSVGGVKRRRPGSASQPAVRAPAAVGVSLGNGCYDDSSETSSEEDVDERRAMDVDDDGCGGMRQLDMDTSSSSSESSQIWVPAGTRLSASGRQLTSPTQLAAVYRLSTGAIEQCRSTDENSSAKRPQHLQQQRNNDANSTNRTVNMNGLLETDIDEVLASAVDAEQQKQTLVPPVDSGLGNDTSPEAGDYANPLTNRRISAADASPSPCSSILRPLPQPSLSFCSPSCSLLRSSTSSVQRQQPADAANGEVPAIYSTPSTCRASIGRMQSIPLPPVDARSTLTGPNEGRSNTAHTAYGPSKRCDTSTILSCLYAMFIVVVGASLSLAEVLSGAMSIATFEGFHTYLLVVGIVFLVLIQLFNARRRGNAAAMCGRRQCKSECGSESLGGGIELGLLHHKTPSAATGATDVDVARNAGTFYLRLGAVGFAIGAMVSEGLQFAQFVEISDAVKCINPTEVVRTLIHILFIFVQLYFLFVHSETRFKRCHSVCRFGLMHLIATNICVWLRVIVLETLTTGLAARLLHFPANDVTTTSAPSASVNVSPISYYHLMARDDVTGARIQVDRIGHHGSRQLNVSADRVACKLPDVTSGILSSLSPYLYSSIIQYCLVAVALNGLIWYNVGRRSRSSNTVTSRHCPCRQFNPSNSSCSGTIPGVFFGLIVLVATVVLLVVSLVLSSNGGGVRSSASFPIAASAAAEAMADLVRLAVSTIAAVATVIVAICLFRRAAGPDGRLCTADLDRGRTTINEILLIFTVTGVVAAGVFGAVAGRRSGRHYAVAGCIASVAHAAGQVVAVIAGARRGAPAGHLSKTGLQAVAFLTVCNAALWLVDALQEGGLPLSLVRDWDGVRPVAAGAVYGELSRRSLVLVCIPLAVFHRFQSVVCLATIWKRG